jgi:anti-sigma factor RsiW
MAECTQIRPLLYQYLEREAGPAEAMDVASHLSGCTACKILLARKRRLARMLEEGLEDSIPVGDEFVSSVMATLPDGPPPRRPIVKRNRGLRLAALVGLLLTLGQTSAGRWPVSAGAWPSLALPNIDTAAGDWPFQGILDCVRWVAVTVETLTGGSPFEVPLTGIGLAVGTTVALIGLVVIVGSSTVLAVAASSYLRSRRV